jgi:tetratricopeptide (TPR) repeat protein
VSTDPAEDRDTLVEQTRRNLDGMELERAGRMDLAIELYEQNLEDGFEGDWPYGRLVAFYEREGRLDEAERVLNRAIEVFKASRRRSAEDRRATLQAFRGRLRLVKQAAKRTGKGQLAREGPSKKRAADVGGSP